MNTNQIIEIITNQIRADHKLEDQINLNNKLSTINYEIDKVETKTLAKNKLKITYVYRILNKQDITFAKALSPEICYERKLIV